MGYTDIYCVICGTSTHKYYSSNLEDLKTLLDQGKYRIPLKSKLSKKEREIDSKLADNYKKFIKDINKIKSKFNWCNKTCLITDKKVVKIDNKFYQDDNGGFEKESEYYNTLKYLWDTSDRALICHQSCYKLLEKKLNYKLKIDDVANKLNDKSLLKSYGKIVDKYTGHQDFKWIWFILNVSPFNSFERLLNDKKKLKISKNIDFLMDPLKNKNNENRILKIWKSSANSKKKKNRPSPSESATLFDVGKKKKGNDGNMYEVVVNKNNIKRWKKISITKKR